MVPTTIDKFQTWADITCLSVTAIKQIIGSEKMQPDSFMPFYMFVSYTFFFFTFFSIYTVLFGSGAHPAFYSEGTVGFSPELKSLIRSFHFSTPFYPFLLFFCCLLTTICCRSVFLCLFLTTFPLHFSTLILQSPHTAAP